MTDKRAKTNTNPSAKNRPKRPASFRGQFSFVNKDASNIDSKEHNSAVAWHVMNRYERWKKDEREKRNRASANVPDDIMSTSPGPSAIPESSLDTRKRSRDEDIAPDPRSPLRLDFSTWMADQPFQTGYSNTPLTNISSEDMPLFSSPMASNYITFNDPNIALETNVESSNSSQPISLNTQAIPVTPRVNNLIAFAYESFVPETWPNEPGRIARTFELNRSYADVSAITGDFCYGNAYLALLATVEDSHSGSPYADETRLEEMQQFKDLAVSELQARMATNGPQDIMTLKAILLLFTCETSFDNMAEARARLRMLKDLVYATGGILILDPWFSEDLLCCDCYFALKCETRPLFPTQDWTPGALDEFWKATLIDAGVLDYHGPYFDVTIEHPLLKTIFTDVRELFRVEEYLSIFPTPNNHLLQRWSQMRRFDCISRLADHRVNLTLYAHLYVRPMIQTLICIGTALMMAMVFGSPEPVRSGLKLITDLRNKILESEAEGIGAGHENLFLWVLHIGSMAEKTHPVSPPNDKWFTMRLDRITRNQDEDEHIEMRNKLLTFLWSERLYQEVENGRDYRIKESRQGLYGNSSTSWREPYVQQQLSNYDRSIGESKGKDRVN